MWRQAYDYEVLLRRAFEHHGLARRTTPMVFFKVRADGRVDWIHQAMGTAESKEERRCAWEERWSFKKHKTFGPAGRQRAVELLMVGALLAEAKGLNREAFVNNVWVDCVMPHAVEQKGHWWELPGVNVVEEEEDGSDLDEGQDEQLQAALAAYVAAGGAGAQAALAGAGAGAGAGGAGA